MTENIMNLSTLVVDLDGTLLRHESTLSILNHQPLAILQIPYWLWLGKSEFNKGWHAVNRYSINPSRFAML